MSRSQTVIKVISIIAVVYGIFIILSGMFATAVCSELASSPEITSSLEGYTEDTGEKLINAAVFMTLGGILDVIAGIFGLGAARDADNAGPAFVMSLVWLLIAVGNFILNAVQGGVSAVMFPGLVLPVIFFVCALNIKKQRDSADR